MANEATDFHAGAVATVKIGGNDVGVTFDGVEIQFEQSEVELECDQIIAAIDDVATKKAVTVRLNVAAVDLDNFIRAWHYPSTNLVSSSVDIDADDDVTTTLEITVLLRNLNTRTYHFYRVRARGTSAHNYKKDGQTFIPIEIKCYYDDTVSRIGYVKDVAP